MKSTNLKTVANEFGMSVEQFKQALKHRRRLPGQLPSRSFLEDQDSEIELSLDTRATRKTPAWKRIKRAAWLQGRTLKEFVTHSIMEMVRPLEEDMVLSPRTGEPICDIAELEEFAAKQ
jgi:hypothetical protein